MSFKQKIKFWNHMDWFHVLWIMSLSRFIVESSVLNCSHKMAVMSFQNLGFIIFRHNHFCHFITKSIHLVVSLNTWNHYGANASGNHATTVSWMFLYSHQKFKHQTINMEISQIFNYLFHLRSWHKIHIMPYQK